MPDKFTKEQKLEIIVKALDSKKAEDIKVIKVGDLTILADYFVIADGTSSTQTKALADETEYKMHENGISPERVQGNNGSNWIILDYGDIVVHVFSKDQRDFYNLERLWRDGEDVDISQWTV
ncbi:MAG: ribosome silencing factor [Oscillospiraceae bacterium]|nr:ribosome silencing factor [Oscillospiraceae bacterium]